MHGKVLGMLQDAGARVSLIGDPNQDIFDFGAAD
jgi:hypothetical protein